MNQHPQPLSDPYAKPRRKLIAHLKKRGFADAAVLEAMLTVPREEFVDPGSRQRAYDDNALPIAAGQTISQPSVVAMMTTALAVSPASRVLEIGTGSGYQAAILARLAESVVSIERYPRLAEHARRAIYRVGIHNVAIHTADGSNGWPDDAPYDRILVTAAAPRIPQPLLSQLNLRDGSRLVVPVGDRELQDLVLVCRSGGQWRQQHIGTVRFVPLRGAAGWSAADWDEN